MVCDCSQRTRATTNVWYFMYAPMHLYIYMIWYISINITVPQFSPNPSSLRYVMMYVSMSVVWKKIKTKQKTAGHSCTGIHVNECLNGSLDAKAYLMWCHGSTWLPSRLRLQPCDVNSSMCSGREMVGRWLVFDGFSLRDLLSPSENLSRRNTACLLAMPVAAWLTEQSMLPGRVFLVFV